MSPARVHVHSPANDAQHGLVKSWIIHEMVPQRSEMFVGRVDECALLEARLPSRKQAD
jgi:hypothetical protein